MRRHVAIDQAVGRDKAVGADSDSWQDDRHRSDHGIIFYSHTRSARAGGMGVVRQDHVWVDPDKISNC